MENATDFEGNMKTFINNYGISIDIPNFYPMGAAVFPQNPRLVLELIQYVIPTSNSVQLRTLNYDAEKHEGKGKDVYVELGAPKNFLDDIAGGAEANKSGCIQLIEMEGKCPKVRKEVSITGSRKNYIAFSPSGEFLIILKKEANNQTLDIYQLGDDDMAIYRVLDQIEKD